MLPADLIYSIKTLAQTERANILLDKPLIAAAPDKGAGGQNANFEIGQRVQAAVQAQVSPNVFNVRVANQLIQMQLPAFVRVGDLVSLQVTSLQPRLTFSLSRSDTPVSTPESLSATARLLSSMSQQPVERSYVRPIQSAPLWTGEQPLPDTTQLANKLHDALSHSGLFYESHQAQWIAGTRPTTQLLLEPQNQLLPQSRPDTAAQAQNAQAAQVAANNANTADAANRTAQAAPLSPNAPTATEQRIAPPHIPEHLQTLVQQQLNTLETRQVLWQGQVWQGQEMRWEVREEPPRRTPQGMESGQWVTQISLDLPNLGNVSARLSLNGNALSLVFDASDAETRAKLGSASPQLITALGERGIPVIQTQVARNEHAG